MKVLRSLVLPVGLSAVVGLLASWLFATQISAYEVENDLVGTGYFYTALVGVAGFVLALIATEMAIRASAATGLDPQLVAEVVEFIEKIKKQGVSLDELIELPKAFKGVGPAKLTFLAGLAKEIDATKNATLFALAGMEIAKAKVIAAMDPHQWGLVRELAQPDISLLTIFRGDRVKAEKIVRGLMEADDAKLNTWLSGLK
ncbi:hypothetical protein HYW55_03805 [Candidatus Gottesmanbacteria bacterium]|nr:hypothetical protein [Candidatus Gottesmanbacteria bacterium]